jgi:hypothetical protein
VHISLTAASNAENPEKSRRPSCHLTQTAGEAKGSLFHPHHVLPTSVQDVAVPYCTRNAGNPEKSRRPKLSLNVSCEGMKVQLFTHIMSPSKSWIM